MGGFAAMALAALLVVALPEPSHPQQWASVPAGTCPGQAIADHTDCDVLFGNSDCDAPLATNDRLSFVSGVSGSMLLREFCPVSCGTCEVSPENQHFRNGCARNSTGGCKTLGACAAAAPWTESRQTFDRVCLANDYAAEPRFGGQYYSHVGAPPSRTGAFHCSCCGAPLYNGTDSFDSGSGWPAYSNTVDGHASIDAAGIPHIHSHAVVLSTGKPPTS